MSYDYFAFISYSRKDKVAARYLQKEFESYRYPAVLVSKEYKPDDPKYLRKIFRDTSDLDATRNSFSESIERNIAGSRYLIVVCSPNSRASDWVDWEIRRFLETHGNNMKAVFPIILEGEIPECLPERLRRPEFLDRNIPTMIPDDASSRKEGWEHGFLQLVGCLLNVSIDKITDRFQKAKQAMLRRIIFVVSAVLAVTIGLTVWALIAEHKANHEAEVAKSSLGFVRSAFDAADPSKSGNKDMTLLEFAKETSGKLDTLKMPEVKLEVATMVLPLLSDMGDPKTALARMLPLLSEAEKQYPAGSLERADFDFAVATLLHSNAEYDKAIDLYRRVLAIYRKKRDNDRPRTAAALNNIGNAYSRKGVYDKALEYYERALTIYRKKPGVDHPDTAGTLNNIGNTYQRMAEYDKAIEYHEQVLTIFRKKLGDDHPVTADTLNNIGVDYEIKGACDKALEYYERALAIYRKKLGDDHPRTADILDNIGNVYSGQGEYDKAIGCYERALAIRQKKDGDDHPRTAVALNNIGNAYLGKGACDKALEYYERALAIRRKKLDGDHRDMAEVLSNIGVVCERKGEYDKAVKYYRQALAIFRKTLVVDHPDTAVTETGLGYSLVMSGAAAEGFETLDHALAVLSKKLGDEHPDTADPLHYRGLARCAMAERKAAGADIRADLQAAEGDLKRALDIRVKSLPPGHPDTVETLKALQRVRELKKKRGSR